MALADRDYARSAPPGGARNARVIRPGGLSITMWLIIINAAVFVLDWMLWSSGVRGSINLWNPNTRQLVSSPYPLLASWGHFSTYLGFTHGQVWRFVTFQFLHADIYHLLFNMLGLWFFGPIVEEALKTKQRCLAFYLACGICGAGLYLILNLVGYFLARGGMTGVPGLLFNDPTIPLVGASAGIFGILLAAAFVAGSETMIIYFIPTTVRAGAYILFALAALNLLMGGQNAGGDAAHIGGGIAGYFLIRRTHLLDDFFDVFGPAPPRKGKPASKRDTPSLQERRRVDAILEKVSRDGLQSLTAKERRFLEEQSRKDGNPLN